VADSLTSEKVNCCSRKTDKPTDTRTNDKQWSTQHLSTLALELALAVMIAVCFFSLGRRIGKQKETDL